MWWWTVYQTVILYVCSDMMCGEAVIGNSPAVRWKERGALCSSTYSTVQGSGICRRDSVMCLPEAKI